MKHFYTFYTITTVMLLTALLYFGALTNLQAKTEKQTDRSLLAIETISNFWLYPTSSELAAPPAFMMMAPSLLLDVSVNTTMPTATESVVYTFRYRCASIVENCLDAQISMEFPAGVEITPPVVAGNVQSFTLTGQMLVVNLTSPGTPGVLSAGSSGIFRVSYTFPCVDAGDPQPTTPGSMIDFVMDPEFSAMGAVTATDGADAVTVPTARTCPPPNPPQPAEFRKSGPVAFTTNSAPQFSVDLPDAANVTLPLTITDDIPAGLLFSETNWNTAGGSATNVNVETQVSCDGGVTYNTLTDVNRLQRAYYDAQLTNGTLNNLTDVNGMPTGCRAIITRTGPASASNPDGPQRNFYGIENATNVRLVIPTTFPSQGPGGNTFPNSRFNFRFELDTDNLTPCEPIQNCVTLTDAGTANELSCVNSRFIGVGDFTNPFLQFAQRVNPSPAAGYLGQSSLPTGLSSGFVSALGGSKNVLDVIYRAQLEFGGSQSGNDLENPRFEVTLPEGFDYIISGADPNEYFIVPGGGSTASDAGCSVANSLFTREVLTSGQIKLTFQTTDCNLIGGIGRRILTLEFTARYVGTRELLNLSPAPPFTGVMTVTEEDGTPFVTNNCTVRPSLVDGTDLVFIQIQNTESSKFVKGALDTDFSRFPQFGFTNLNGDGEYVLEITNLDVTGVSRIDVVDILPHINDFSLLVPSQGRLSQWSAELDGAIIIERSDIPGNMFTDASANIVGGVQYSNTYTPCYLNGSMQVELNATNGPTGCSAGGFSTANPAVGARGFAFRWEDTGSPLAFGEKIRIRVDIRQLTGEPDATTGEIAWNSLAFTATNEDGDEFLSSEPIKVGLQMVDQTDVAGLGNFVWEDANNNGRQDAGERGFEGITVRIYDTAGNPILSADGMTPLTALTDANGFYSFPTLMPSTAYIVRLDNPSDFSTQFSGYNLTTTNAAGVDDALDSDASVGNVANVAMSGNFPEISATTPVAGEFDPDFDFGFYKPARVAGIVSLDLDEGGDRDVGEDLVENVTVTLRRASDNSIVSGPITTGATGQYAFEDLSPGTYYVEFTNLPAGTVPTFKDITSDDFTDSDVNSNGRTDVFDIVSCDDLSFDLGLRNQPMNPASIAGTVWDELGTKNGQIDANEPGVSGVTVQLLDANQFVITSTITDANGDYLFENLAPNTNYFVAVIPPSLTTPLTSSGPDMDVDPASGVSMVITPNDNENVTDVDAGLCGLLSIGNLVFNDANNNGLLDASETGISGVDVFLIAQSDGITVDGVTYNTGEEIAMTTTDANGRYVFKFLPSGAYSVEVEAPGNDLLSSVDISSTPTPNEIDSDDNGLGFAGTGRIASNNLMLDIANVGAPTDPNWTEADDGVFIMAMDDPVTNPKAYYTVDFGFFLPPPCPDLDMLAAANTIVCVGSTTDLTITHSADPGTLAIVSSTNASLTASELYDVPEYTNNDIMLVNGTVTPMMGAGITVVSGITPPAGATTYYVILAQGNPAILDPICLPFASVTITGTTQPEAGMQAMALTICETATTTINLFDELDGEDPMGTWTAGAMNPMGGMFDAGAGEFDPTGVSVGTYTFIYSFAATGGCMADDATVTIVVEDQAEAGAQAMAAMICESSTTTINLFDELDGEDPMGTWTAGAMNPMGGMFNAGAGEFDPTGVSVGTYTFIYSFTATAVCAADDATVTINVTAQPEAGAQAMALTICETATTTINLFDELDGEDPMGTWTAGAMNPMGGMFDAGAGEFDPTGAGIGTYTFTYSFAAVGGCMADDATVTVIVEEQPEAGAQAMAAMICESSTTTINLFDELDGEDPMGTWTAGAMNPMGGMFDAGAGEFDPTGVSVGTYTFIYSFTAGTACQADMATVTIEVAAQPEAGMQAMALTICETATTPINLFDELDGEDPMGTWAAGAMNPMGGMFDAGAGTFEPIGASVGTYTFTYSFAAAGGCAADDATVTIIVENQPEAGMQITPLTICQISTTTIDLFAQLTGADMGGDWTADGSNPGNTGFNTAGTFDPTGTPAGTYTFNYTFSAGAACAADMATVTVVVDGVDYGDLPDGTIAGTPDYPTTLADGGPRHCVPATPALYLGNTVIVDTEADGQPDADPNNAGDGDDEDGFDTGTMFVAGITVNATIPIVNTTGSAATLVAYADWNNNGTLNDAGEVFTISLASTDVSATVPFVVPTNAVLNTNLGLRFRLSTDASAVASPTGDAPDGEVEDYFIQVMGFDFGDLVDLGPGTSMGNYETQTASNGARHKISTDPTTGSVNLKIGATVDAEADGQQSPMAMGDGADEDGLTLPTFTTGIPVNIPVDVMNMTGMDATLVLFIDWNDNGVLNDAGEVYTETVINGATIVTFNVTPPLSAVLTAPLGVRLRLSTDATAAGSPTGVAPDGEIEDYINPSIGFDYGDLPDTGMGTGGDPSMPLVPANYQTLRGDNGARHQILTDAVGNPLLKIGAAVDDEADGQPSADAGEMGGDDNNGVMGDPDDEDGIDLATIPLFILTQTTTLNIPVMNMSGADATLAVFIDFNKDGSFDATTEKFTAAVPQNTMTEDIAVSIPVPVASVVGQDLGMRIRLANDMAEVMIAVGTASTGEVEDYMIQVVGFDYGDLPDTYGTEDPNGPKHIVNENLTLGTCVDSEINGLPEAMAGLMSGGDDNDPGLATFGACNDGDDDEDGIEFVTPMLPGEEACISVTAVNNTASDAVLQMWVDFDGDGIFSIAEEITFTSANGNSIPMGGGVADELYCFDVPTGAIFREGAAFVRFRLSPMGGLPPNSQALPVPFGEIEDYKVPLAKLGNLVWEDSNFDGTQDMGEAGLEGVTLNLEWTNPAGGTEMYTTTTDANGNYYFCGLIPGEYEVTVIDPDDLTASPSDSGNDDFDDSDRPSVSVTITDPIALPTGEDGLTDTPGAVDNFPDAQEDISIDFGYVGIDYGDLPDGFETLLATDGARHLMQDGKYLGSSVDAEENGAPTFEAGRQGDGDDGTVSSFAKGTAGVDDEDGVRFLTPLVPGNVSCIEVTSTLPTGGGFLNGWIDFNGNDIFEANEQITFE
ncbi:MAG: SdrD B-like domain-containing protein, partial [Bacteroidota bacterium]